MSNLNFNPLFYHYDDPEFDLAWEWLKEEGYDPDNYMYMYTYDGYNFFKHYDTREYIKIVERLYTPQQAKEKPDYAIDEPEAILPVNQDYISLNNYPDNYLILSYAYCHSDGFYFGL